MKNRFNIRMPNLPRLGGGMNLYIAVVTCIVLITSFVAYLITGIMISADLPIVRSFKEPEVVMPASMDAYNISLTWENPKVYSPMSYKTIFSENETEDEFYKRMADIDRRSLYQLTQKYPALLQNGLSNIKFDATQDQPSEFLDADTNVELKTELMNGAVKTKQGHKVLAMDGTKSMVLVQVEINDTEGYMAISYDKSKLLLSVTRTAFDGRWGNVIDHIKQNDGAVAAIPANNYTYNAKAGYGVVDGGFVDNSISRYNKSDNYDLYMGFSREGLFTVGDRARLANTNFTEGLGVLLANGEIPFKEVVPANEQKQIMEALAAHIKAAGGNPEDKDYDAVPVIKSFIETFDSNLLRAKTSWVIENQTIQEMIGKKFYPKDATDIIAYTIKLDEGVGAPKELKEAVELVKMCRTFDSDQYAQKVIPVRSAYTAIGQRHKDGMTVLFGIGGAKKPDSRLLPGNGATVDDIRQLFLAYDLTEAALTTSGDRVGFGWKDKNLLHVQDTTKSGGNSYGAYILK